MATNTRLSQRSSQERLVATPAGKDPVVTDLLRAEACAGAWRIVEAFSASGGPFELLVAWSGGDGVGQEARLTVPRATRLAVYASSMTVRVANLVPVENRVGCSVADGYCVSANQYEVRGVVPSSAAAPIPVAIPPFATNVRVDVSDVFLLESVRIQILDGLGAPRAAIRGDQQPLSGLPLGAAAGLQLLVPPGLAWRAVFQLSI